MGLYQPLAVVGWLAQFPDRRRRHETATQQTVLEQLSQPLGVEDITRATGEDLDVLGVHELELEGPLFQHIQTGFITTPSLPSPAGQPINNAVKRA